MGAPADDAAPAAIYGAHEPRRHRHRPSEIHSEFLAVVLGAIRIAIAPSFEKALGWRVSAWRAALAQQLGVDQVAGVAGDLRSVAPLAALGLPKARPQPPGQVHTGTLDQNC